MAKPSLILQTCKISPSFLWLQLLLIPKSASGTGTAISTSPATLSSENMSPSLTDPCRVSSCLLLRVTAWSTMTELGECTSAFMRIFCGSHSYFIAAQCSDVAWIPAPAHQENPISILGCTHRHLTAWDICSNHSHPLFSQTGVFP